MPYFRNRGSTTVKSDKHEITWSQLSTAANTGTQIVLASTVNVGAKNGASECAVGSHVRGIYLEFHFSAEDVSNANVVHWTIEVLGPTQTATQPNTYYTDQRSYIIQRGMEMLPKDVSTVFKRIVFVKVPKIYQRRKMGDFIIFKYITSAASLINACGIAIYKEKY